MKLKASSRAVWLACCMIALTTAASSQTAPFAGGWTLDPLASRLTVQSIKDPARVETSSFAGLDGMIDEAGEARITVHLETVDTRIDLRNVRMRFLFFETFRYPEAKITARIDPDALTGLEHSFRKVITLPYRLDLHGVVKSLEAEVEVTLLDEDQVLVASVQPISLPVADFALEHNLRKLEEAADVTIHPEATVTFSFLFSRNDGIMPAQMRLTTVTPDGRALESAGELALDECRNRFLSLSEANEIDFVPATDRLRESSHAALDSLAEIIRRCPGLLIGITGHADAAGADAAGSDLPERLASTVASYLAGRGIAEARLHVRRPDAADPPGGRDIAPIRSPTRRIEFAILE